MADQSKDAKRIATIFQDRDYDQAHKVRLLAMLVSNETSNSSAYWVLRKFCEEVLAYKF